MIAAGIVMLISVTGAIVAVSVKNMVHAIFGLGVALAGLALAFLLLSSPFVAAMEVLIYIGGITIAMVFAVMLSSTGTHETGEAGPKRALAALVAGIFFLAMSSIIVSTTFATVPARSPEELEAAWSVQAMGRLLLNEFNVAFELLSVVLLVAIVGAITIASRHDDQADPPANNAASDKGGEA